MTEYAKAKRPRWTPGGGDPSYYAAIAKAKELEAVSMLNMAYFYLPTLKAIAEGEGNRMTRKENGELLSYMATVKLKKYGLIGFLKGRPTVRSSWILTNKGKEIYSKLIQSPIPT